MNGSTLALGAPVVRGALALFPVTSTAPAAPDYLTGPEAERRGELHVAEIDGGSVPHLLVENTGRLAVLLIEGETIVGLKQNRTLITSVLLPPDAASVTVPVSCVEQGRWGRPNRSSRSRRHAPSDLRRVQHLGRAAHAAEGHATSDQIAVWNRVAEYQDSFALTTPTSALEDVYESVEPELNSLVANLRPEPEQCGVIAVIGGRVRGLDLFDKPSTLAAYWDGLLAGYALDALGATGDAPLHESNVTTFLDRLERARTDTVSAPGIGTHRLLAGAGVTGHTLEWNGVRIHVAAFATD